MSYPTTPGLFHEVPAADTRPVESLLPIAIVADDYDQALEYVLSAPMSSPYYVVLSEADLVGVRVGGLALLAQVPLTEGLKAALTRACGLSG